jgi:ribosomal protein L11 methylase PrmA
MERKKQVVSGFIDRIKPASVWDLGANTGMFSRLAAERGIPTIAFDIDPAAVEENFLACRGSGAVNILPLVMDLTNPSPSLGWRNHERMSLQERGPADLVMALALVHHLAISNNVPLPMVAELFHLMGRSAIVEFVPKSDSQVKRLLASREDIFPGYTQKEYESEMGRFFHLREAVLLKGTERSLYLLERR